MLYIYINKNIILYYNVKKRVIFSEQKPFIFVRPNKQLRKIQIINTRMNDTLNLNDLTVYIKKRI